MGSDEFTMHRLLSFAALVLFNVHMVEMLVAAGSHKVCNVGKVEKRDIDEVLLTFVLILVFKL